MQPHTCKTIISIDLQKNSQSFLLSYQSISHIVFEVNEESSSSLKQPTKQNKVKTYHTHYKIGITVKSAKDQPTSYRLIFNGTDKSIRIPMVGFKSAIEHAQLLMKGMGIRVQNYVHNEAGDYVLVIPMAYWDKVRNLFLIK
jgi:hypothetical protein